MHVLSAPAAILFFTTLHNHTRMLTLNGHAQVWPDTCDSNTMLFQCCSNVYHAVPNQHRVNGSFSSAMYNAWSSWTRNFTYYGELCNINGCCFLVLHVLQVCIELSSSDKLDDLAGYIDSLMTRHNLVKISPFSAGIVFIHQNLTSAVGYNLFSLENLCYDSTDIIHCLLRGPSLIVRIWRL